MSKEVKSYFKLGFISMFSFMILATMALTLILDIILKDDSLALDSNVIILAFVKLIGIIVTGTLGMVSLKKHKELFLKNQKSIEDYRDKK